MINLQEIIKDMAISNFKRVITDATKEQIEFATEMTERLISDTDTGVVNAIPARCGFGKSVLIRCYLKAVVFSANIFGIFGATREEYKGEGFVIVTDLLDRFLEYEKDDGLDGHYYEMRQDREDGATQVEQILEQNNYPILLMTTQKYFQLKENEREFIFKWKHGDRKTVIFDEKPLFYDVVEVDKKFIHNIDYDIGMIHESHREDKNFLNSEMKYLKDYMENEWQMLSNKSESDVICYWKGVRKNIGTDDNRLITLANEHLSPETKNNIIELKNILKYGAIFVNKKNESSKDNRRFFFTIKDNVDGFYLNQDKAKFWIFDATADIDVEYERDYIDVLELNREVKYPINIKNINIGTSRNNTKNDKNLTITLNNYLAKNHSQDSLLLTYMEYLKNINGFNETKKHFGGVKGMNDYRDRTQFLQVGLNRFGDIGYLQIYLSLNKDEMDKIRENPSKSDIEFENLLKLEGGNFKHKGMNDIMYSKLLAETEQNMFRTKLRNYSNTDIVDVYLFHNSITYMQLNEMLVKRLNIEEVEIDIPIEFIESKINNRDTKTETIPQKFTRWFDENEGLGEVRIGDIRQDIGVDAKQFERAKRNKSFASLMDSRKSDRVGYYIA